MARIDNLTNFLTDIAGAIKEKKGDQTDIPASSFDTEITSFQIGGTGIDWSEIGYSTVPETVSEAYTLGKSILTDFNPTYNSTYGFYSSPISFSNYPNLVILPKLPLTNYAPFNGEGLFADCASLVEIPSDIDFDALGQGTYSSSSSGAADRMFENCRSLSKIPSTMSFANANGVANHLFYSCEKLESIKLNIPKITFLDYAFSGCKSLEHVEIINAGELLQLNYTFRSCKNLQSFSITNAPKLWHYEGIFQYCTSLTETPNLPDHNNGTYKYAFSGCTNLTTCTLDLTNAIDTNSMFQSCNKLTTFSPGMNLSKVKDMQYMFYGCRSLVTLPELDCDSCVNVQGILDSCDNLTNIGGFKNLGKAYLTTTSANTSAYRIYLGSELRNLTKQSILNIFNSVYDIASKGCNVQQIYVPSTLYNQLTSEEIAIATNKGWSVHST